MNIHPSSPRRIGRGDMLAAILIYAQTTNLYVFISGNLNTRFEVLGTAILLGLIGYLMAVPAALARTLSHGPALAYIILFSFLPLLTLSYSPALSLRVAAYELLTGVVFASTCAWSLRNGEERLSKLILAIWVTSVAGVFLSYFFPQAFNGVVELAGMAPKTMEGRAAFSAAKVERSFGFYMQPNTCCIALCFQLTFLRATHYLNRPFAKFLATTITLLAAFSTGSRGGLFATSVLLTILFLNDLFLGIPNHKQNGRTTSAIPYYIAVTAAGFIALTLALEYLEGVPETGAAGRVLRAITNPLSLANDESLAARLESQQSYLQAIRDRPLFGHGLGSSIVATNSGLLARSSHNNFLELAFEFGLPLASACYLHIFSLALSRLSRNFRRSKLFAVSLALTGIIVIGSFAHSELFDHRFFPAYAGIWLSLLLVNTPSYVGSKQPTRTPGSYELSDGTLALRR